ncbi:MAG: hypothetical protein EXS05_19475 [Planctomycetaceae bacterium]|nr:hypothetical protein [Planctomycetaceae bacterium]
MIIRSASVQCGLGDPVRQFVTATVHGFVKNFEALTVTATGEVGCDTGHCANSSIVSFESQQATPFPGLILRAENSSVFRGSSMRCLDD